MQGLATTLAVCCAVAVTSCRASQKPADRGHLEHLDATIGEWKLEGQWADGVEFVGEESTQWMMDGKFRRSSGWTKNRDGEKVQYRIVMGWDPVAREVYSEFVRSDGGHSRRERTYDARSKMWTARETGVNADGTTYSLDVTENYSDPDRVTWRGTNIKRSDGTSMPDLQFHLVRQTSEPSVMPDEVRTQLSRLVGSRDLHGTLGDRQLKSTLTARWAAGGQSLLWDLVGPSLIDADRTLQSSGSMGWDHQKQQIREVAFNSIGGSHTTLWTVRPDRWNGRRSGMLDGQGVELRVRLKWQPGDDDGFELRFSKRTVGCEPQDDLTMVARRKS